MTTLDIDLKQDAEEETEEMSVTPGEKEADETVESEYPHFHFETDEELKIPKTGRMLVEYEIVFEGGEEQEAAFNYKVDLHRIVGAEPLTPAKPVRTEEALDQLAAEKMAAAQ